MSSLKIMPRWSSPAVAVPSGTQAMTSLISRVLLVPSVIVWMPYALSRVNGAPANTTVPFGPL